MAGYGEILRTGWGQGADGSGAVEAGDTVMQFPFRDRRREPSQPRPISGQRSRDELAAEWQRLADMQARLRFLEAQAGVVDDAPD